VASHYSVAVDPGYYLPELHSLAVPDYSVAWNSVAAAAFVVVVVVVVIAVVDSYLQEQCAVVAQAVHCCFAALRPLAVVAFDLYLQE